MQQNMRVNLLSDTGKTSKVVYSLFLNAVSATGSSWELGWRVNNQAPKSRIYTDYNKARREFTRRLNRELDRDYEVQTASDSVWSLINSRTVHKLALRERITVSRHDARLRPAVANRKGRVLQAVPDGEHLLVVCCGTESEPYGIDAAGHRYTLPSPVVTQLKLLSAGHDALSLPKHLDVFEAVLRLDQLVLLDVRVVARQSYDRLSADGRLCYLRELIKTIGSSAVVLAPMARGTENSAPILRYIEKPDWHIAASEPVDSLWGAADRWLECGTHCEIEVRVCSGDDGQGRVQVEQRTTLGGWCFAGWAATPAQAPRVGDIVRVRYASTDAMSGELLDAALA